MKILGVVMDGSPKGIDTTLRFMSDAIKHDCQGVKILSPPVLITNHLDNDLRTYGVFVNCELPLREVAETICRSFRRIFPDSQGLMVTVNDIINDGVTYEEKMDA